MKNIYTIEVKCGFSGESALESGRNIDAYISRARAVFYSLFCNEIESPVRPYIRSHVG